MANLFNDRARAIRLAIFDVDGVLTDGRLYYADDGQEFKAFNTLDGHGLKMLQATGIELAIITGRTSNVVSRRADNLGIQHLYQGVEGKLAVYEHLLDKLGLTPEMTAYMGDDVVDLPVMRRCGLALTVPAAPELVKRHAHYVTAREGGLGAVREICERIMLAQGTFDTQMALYLT